MVVTLVRIGGVDTGILDAIRVGLSETRPDIDFRLGAADLDPISAWRPDRGQYLSTELLHLLDDGVPEGDRVVGVAAVDLFIPVLTHVYGEALLDRSAAVISLHRLDPAFYGLPPDPARLASRARTEIIHELGHTWGLVHCIAPECVMRSSHAPEEIDLKGPRFCADCRAVLGLEVGHAGDPPSAI